MKRILIVEDQEDLRAILRDLLMGSGYEVIEVVDGAGAVAKAQASAPLLRDRRGPNWLEQIQWQLLRFCDSIS